MLDLLESLVTLTNLKDGMIVVIKRCQWNKELKIRVKNNERILVQGSFTMATKNCGVVKYDLTAAIQHLGGAEGGHYVAHLKDKNEFFTVNDNKPVCKMQPFELELSQIFIYTNSQSALEK